MQEKTLAREKKVGKQFQYDMPSDLLMTFLSEVRVMPWHILASWLAG